ncbi:MAG: tyrosine--tRNA ligase [Mycoplasmatales bacterium]
MNIYDELLAKGIVKQVTNENIREHLSEPRAIYCGFDPSGPSLHVGHLVTIMLLKHFERAGHTPIVLIGGATGLIGDPSFKDADRPLISVTDVESYTESLSKQLKSFFTERMVFVSNLEWTKDISMLTFLRDIGKYFNVNTMMSKESVARRMETGISFTEFSYQILQAMDFKVLYEKYGCTIQAAGSDQWGNITAGTELIRKTNDDAEAYGMTVHLVTKADGTKFGKSEGHAIWLDPKLTSPYEFYQFFYNSSDADVIKYLGYFTFLSIDEINELKESVEKEPFKRLAQKTLAEHVTSFVHGGEALIQVEKVSNALFSGVIDGLSLAEIEMIEKQLETIKITEGEELGDILIKADIASSKREVREFLTANAIKINGTLVTDEFAKITEDLQLFNKYSLIKRGKKKYALAIMEKND